MNRPLEILDFTERVAKRAQYESFTIRVDGCVMVVRNESHAEPSDHEYRVTVADGVPTTCECPADEHHEGACKHRVAVAMCEPVLLAAVGQRAAPSATRRDSETDQAC